MARLDNTHGYLSMIGAAWQEGGIMPSFQAETRTWVDLGAEADCDVRLSGLLRGCLAVQGVLEFLLVFLGQGGLQDRAAVFAHRFYGLVGSYFLQQQEQRGSARFEHVADLVLELLVDKAEGISHPSVGEFVRPSAPCAREVFRRMSLRSRMPGISAPSSWRA